MTIKTHCTPRQSVFDRNRHHVRDGRIDALFGIWGEHAEQLGKKDVFKDYYQTLQEN